PSDLVVAGPDIGELGIVLLRVFLSRSLSAAGPPADPPGKASVGDGLRDPVLDVAGRGEGGGIGGGLRRGAHVVGLADAEAEHGEGADGTHLADDQVQAGLSLIAGETRRQYELHLCALMSFARGSKRGGAVDSAPAGRTLRTDFRLRRGTYSSSSSVSSSSSLPSLSWKSTLVSLEMESNPLLN